MRDRRARSRRPGGPRHVVGFLFDGVNPNVLYAMAAAGEAPNVARLIEMGTAYEWGAMAGLPTVTLANHTSILTGRLPGHHGILHNAWFDRAPRRAGDHELAGHVAVGDGAPHAGGRVPARRHPPRPAGRVHRLGERALRPRCRLLDLRLLPPRRGAADPRVTRGAAAHDRAVRAPVEGLLVVVGRRPHGRGAGRRHLERVTTATCRSRRRRSCGATSPSPTPRSTRGARSRRSPAASVRDSDARVGDVLAAVERSGAFDDTAFVLVADHGMQETDPAVRGDWDVELRAAGDRVPRRGLLLPLSRLSPSGARRPGRRPCRCRT